MGNQAKACYFCNKEASASALVPLCEECKAMLQAGRFTNSSKYHQAICDAITDLELTLSKIRWITDQLKREIGTTR